MSREAIRASRLTADEIGMALGKSLIVRNTDEEFAELVRVTDESGAAWLRHNVPIMRDEVFGSLARFAERVEPVEPAPRTWHDTLSFPSHVRFRQAMLGDQHQVHPRINDDEGRFVGVLWLWRSTMGESLLQRLGRGDQRLFERMERVKHAGDGGSALFLAGDFDGSESAAARAAIEAAREIRDGAGSLGPDDISVKLNVGVHWGATLMVGQVATGGRLEVTALGDQMNEGARIEAAAIGGAILASKDVIERLDSADAKATHLDPDKLAYTPLGELDGASEKAIRDAGTIPVARI